MQVLALVLINGGFNEVVFLENALRQFSK